MKMFFERETLNPNNKYFVKTIRYKLQYTMYGSTTTIVNLISLADIGTRVEVHFQLPSSLVL